MAAVYHGVGLQYGTTSANVKLGGVNAPPIEFTLDDQLPVLGQDTNYPNRDWVVIPHGRIVAPKATTLTRTSNETVLTMANGVDPLDAPSFATGINAGNIPFGYAPYHLYRSFPGQPADKPLGVKHETIELPYTAINESYCNSNNGGSRLVVGEWLMPYYGSTNRKTAVSPKDRGKLVRWVGRRVHIQNITTASGHVRLTYAPYPAFKPSILHAFTDTGVPVASGATLNYDEAVGMWTATFASTIKSVAYQVGAGSDQKIAQVMGIEPVGTAGGLNASSHSLPGWLQWVTDNFGAWDLPPIMNIRNSTDVTAESVTITDNIGTLAHSPVIPFKTITVKISGSVVDEDGDTTSYDGTTALPLADTMYFKDFTQGRDYDIDMLTGTLTFKSNVTVYSCTVDYSYEAAFADGLKWDNGILGLTDGSGGSGITGLPAHLDVAGVKGVLRAMVL